MPRVYAYVLCPYCKSQYRNETDETHAEGCPRPLERQLERLQRQQVINKCPHCNGDVHINGGDCFECLGCNTQWVASWTQGIDAIRTSIVTFQVATEPTRVTELEKKGEGIFPLRDLMTRLSREIMAAKTKFLAE